MHETQFICCFKTHRQIQRMHITSSNVDIRSDHFHGISSINFQVKGYLSSYSCGVAAKAWKDLAVKSHEKHVLVMDLTQMTAHEHLSRQIMLDTLCITSRKIKAVILITNSLVHGIYLRLLLRKLALPRFIIKSQEELGTARAQLALI